LEIVNTKLRLTKIVDSSYSTPFYSSLKNFQFENVDYLILLLEKSDKALTLLDLYFKDFYYVVGNYLLLDFQFGELSVKGKNYKKYKEIKIKNDLLDKLNNLLNTSEPKLQDYGLNYFEDCVDKMYGNDLLNRFKRLFYSEEYKKSLVARCELVKLYEKDFNEYQETYKNIVNQLKEFVGEPNYYYGTDELNAYKKLLVRSIPKSNNYVTTIEYQKRVIKSRFKYEIRKIQSIQKDLLKNERSYWLGLSGHDFEKAVTQLFFKVDLNPYLTSGSDDHGIDIILTVADMQIPVQCKNHSKPMSPSAIRDFQGASSTRFQSQKSIFISSNSYSPKAVQQASLSGMLLLDVDSLLQINIQKGYDYTKLINYLK
jgi:HJR/Mrr/RecB family endonuclease